MKKAVKSQRFLIPFIILSLITILLIQNCTKETIVIYKPFPQKVALAYPSNSDPVFQTMPTLFWEPLDEAVNYQIQLANDPAFSNLVFTETKNDTLYSHPTDIDYGHYYWRVRAKNIDDIWGDWSDAAIRSFYIGDNSNVVELAYPPNTNLTFVETPELIWNQLNGAVVYQVMIATNSSFTNIEVTDTIASDTVYTCGDLSNDTYYWRVRAKNNLNVWGDWSDAMVWSFRINDSPNYIALLAVMETPGTAQDVFVNPETDDSTVAYVADGNAMLTMFDVTDPAEPVYITNLNREDGDFARSVWKVQDDHIAYVADADGKTMALDIRYPFDPDSPRSRSIGYHQNLEDLAAVAYPNSDTIYLFTVNSGFGKRWLYFYRLTYEDGVPTPENGYQTPLEIIFPSDPKGVYYDTMSVYVEYCDTTNDIYTVEYQSGMFVFVAASQAGLWWINVSATHTADGTDSLLLNSPQVMGWGDTPSIALAVQVQNGFAYVADDRGGLQIFDLPDTIPSFDHDSLYSADPVLISSINTSGRTKDVHVVGNRCYLADGSGGLKVIDISNPYAPIFLAAYSTPYAYGVWADEENTYVTDRDNGLMIFENR